MRIAMISDIHGNLSALDAVLADIGRRGIEQIVNLGDCLSGPFDAAGTANRLMDLGLPTVKGNHDRQLIDRPKEDMGTWESWCIDDLSPSHLTWVRELPKSIAMEDVLLCHATPDDDAENWLDFRGPQDRLVARDLDAVAERLGSGAGASLIACGHTHTPRTVRLPGGPVVVNPGAVGCPAYLDTRMEPNFVHQTGAGDARYAIVERTNTGWHVSLMAVPYDPAPMAALARAKGAESWARAVESGWIA